MLEANKTPQKRHSSSPAPHAAHPHHTTLPSRVPLMCPADVPFTHYMFPSVRSFSKYFHATEKNAPCRRKAAVGGGSGGRLWRGAGGERVKRRRARYQPPPLPPSFLGRCVAPLSDRHAGSRPSHPALSLEKQSRE